EFEVIIVNDGSTDNSLEIVEKIKDDRIRIIDKPNGGVSSARNRGIKEAKYDWICFLDADDLWKNYHLQELAKMILLYPNEKVFATTFEYSDKRKVYEIENKLPIFKVDNYFEFPIHLIWTSAVAIHIDCFNKVGYFNEKLVRGEDKDLWARLGKEYSIIKSKKITSTYRVDAENRSNKTIDVLKTYEAHINFNNINKPFEKEYYKKLLILKLKYDFVLKDYKSFFYLLKKYNL